ncbi:NAD(P)/FAD-dependent oxidoreductase [Nocardioides agariphilus]|jgi:UDP-galactopyranose mutase|uniref:NAD(P)/FAD-dependent oxidoreductase n=1 Tax=Nocardioides agariphilus TaxID=433664 RepID=A0A930VGV9_9ACTN|nr:FAD-dependent oxidoreductase [Nocardioides agariphilus]MBF4767304.1 NAD(P)/FAD-dependent oxidoreductase [Nocardioides agariphilus]
MAKVAVVGGGFGGLAAAARLAKLGHAVTLLERAERIGGALLPVEQDGFSWEGGPTYTVLPAVLRDLFRKSGRPLERELELVELDVLREHRFADGSSVSLPPTRGAQVAALEAMEPGLGTRWADYVHAYADDWEVLRREYLERPWDPARLPPALAARLRKRESLARHARRLRDDRLRQMALYPAEAEGHDPRDVPAWVGVTAYVEQRFGSSVVSGGMQALLGALVARLATRRVDVLRGTEVRDLQVRDGRAIGVVTEVGVVESDVVVVACDPRRLPALSSYVARTMPALPPVMVHLGLAGDLPEMAHETVLHGEPREPTIVVRANGPAWTLLGRGRVDEDLVTTLARRGIDIRSQVVTRVDRSPRDLVEAWGGSPYGVLWQGPRTVLRRLGPGTPVAGVYAVGAHATPGAGLPYVGLSAALVAQVVGPA